MTVRKQISVLQIVEQYLKSNGYDGLFNSDGECACKLNDLSPGDCMTEECSSGYLAPCDCGDGHEFHIQEAKP